jgi:hypothetical protein
MRGLDRTKLVIDVLRSAENWRIQWWLAVIARCFSLFLRDAIRRARKKSATPAEPLAVFLLHF